MPKADPMPILRALVRLLEREAVLVRRADFAALAAVVPEKEGLMGKLAAADPPPPEALEGLRVKAGRNQSLMAAALRGVRSARKRFEMLRSAQTSLTTYDHLGRKCDISMEGSSHEHRA